MKKIYLVFLLVSSIAVVSFAQQYSYYPYGGSSATAYTVPDVNVSHDSVFHMLEGNNYEIGKDAREFDQVSPGETSSLNSDEGKTFGINEPYSADTGGGEIRGWTTLGGDDAAKYAAVRWNANPGTFRMAGQWAMYTVNFTEAGSYHLYLRIRGSNTGHNYAVTAYNPSNMTKIKEWALDLNDFPWGLDSVKNGVTHVGDARADKDGQAGSEWMRIEEVIEVTEAGNVVFKIDNANGATNGSFGAFTLMKSVSTGVAPGQMQEVAVYPNPVKNTLHFNRTVKSVTVANIAGQTVLQKKGISSIDMGGLQTGLYFVRIADGEKLIVKKVLKQ
jgi:hypothetical protein